MKEDLIKLRNTMGLVETKNDSTKLMAQCLIFVEELIQKSDSPIQNINTDEAKED